MLLATELDELAQCTSEAVIALFNTRRQPPPSTYALLISTQLRNYKGKKGSCR